MKTAPIITLALTTTTIIAVVSAIPFANQDPKYLTSQSRAKRSGWAAANGKPWASGYNYEDSNKYSSYQTPETWSVSSISSSARAASTIAPVQSYDNNNQYAQSTGSMTASASSNVQQSYNNPVQQQSFDNQIKETYGNHVRDAYGNYVHEYGWKGKGEGGQSYIWQSTPDYTYSIHQRHPLVYRHYSHYPNYATNGW